MTLSRIYTRGGDKGETSLGDGSRVPKHDLRVAAYGTVDETNGVIGVARLSAHGQADAMLGRIQNDLFDLERETHAAIYDLHRDLLRLRRDDPVLRLRRPGGVDGAVLGPGAFVLRFFGEGDDRLLLVNLDAELHLDPAPEPLLAPLQGCTWELSWSSEDPRYGGTGTPPVYGEENWRLPGRIAVLLQPAPGAWPKFCAPGGTRPTDRASSPRPASAPLEAVPGQPLKRGSALLRQTVRRRSGAPGFSRDVDHARQHGRFLRATGDEAAIEHERRNAIDAESMCASVVAVDDGEVRVAAQVRPQKGHVEVEIAADLSEHTHVADISATHEMVVEQRLHHPIGSTVQSGEADQTVGVDGVRRAANTIEGEIDFDGLAHVGDRHVDTADARFAPELADEVSRVVDALRRQIRIEQERPPTQSRIDARPQRERAFELSFADIAPRTAGIENDLNSHRVERGSGL